MTRGIIRFKEVGVKAKFQTSYEVGDIVLRRNDYTKKGHCCKLKSVWTGYLQSEEQEEAICSSS